ncbi:MAG: hypothetical protein QOI76_306 [Frankiales bacterium]|jgi:hypothetical protein|nr:hypothetical protein [Frankiales bacterium]
MDTGDEALSGRHGGEQLHQTGSLRGAQPGGELLLVLTGQYGQLAHQLITRRRQVKRVLPSISRMTPSFEAAAVLQLVDENDHTAWQQSELLTERLLAAARLDRDGAEDARLGRTEVQHGDAIGEQ